MAVFNVDPASFVPIYEQVKKEIRRLVALGALKPDESLPSIRDLAGDLVVNPNTVARAYRELEQDGLIYTQKGRGSFVAGRDGPRAEKAREALLGQTFDQAIDEARKFGLGPAEILKLVERRLRRREGGDGK
jgi:GntR family transcriptional regulator